MLAVERGSTMLAAVLDAPGLVNVRPVPLRTTPGQVVVQVEQAGICGTNALIASGAVPTVVPRILGHEIVGRVADLGGAEGFALSVGERVLVDPS